MKITINGISGAVEEALDRVFVKCMELFSLTEQQAKAPIECFVMEYCDDLASLNDALNSTEKILDSYNNQVQEIQNHEYAPF